MTYLSQNGNIPCVVYINDKSKRELYDSITPLTLNCPNELTIITMCDNDNSILLLLLNENNISYINAYDKSDNFSFFKKLSFFPIINESLKQVHTKYVMYIEPTNSKLITFDNVIENFMTEKYKLIFGTEKFSKETRNITFKYFEDYLFFLNKFCILDPIHFIGETKYTLHVFKYMSKRLLIYNISDYYESNNGKNINCGLRGFIYNTLGDIKQYFDYMYIDWKNKIFQSLKNTNLVYNQDKCMII